jgi:Pyrimidine dimer DNA glycosylase
MVCIGAKMRLWSLHPSMLDQKGLVALWREALLAKAVLEGKTKGYKNHSQLVRFKAMPDPVLAINQYLSEVWIESKSRGYNFDVTKITAGGEWQDTSVTTGQLEYEFKHLQNKLVTRCPIKYALNYASKPKQASMFKLVEGPIESWEITK